MRVLGAILAGGRSSRFGGDKALAMIDGDTLFGHALAALSARADAVVSCGRPWPGVEAIADRPHAGGPLAGLNAALAHGRARGFDAVLCVPIDVYPVAAALDRIGTRPRAVLRTQWTVGLWPVALAPALDRHLASGARSMRGWLTVSAPAIIEDRDLGLRNINHAGDLDPPAARPAFDRGQFPRR